MKQEVFWIPNPRDMENDQRDYERVVLERRLGIELDHENNSCAYGVWISDLRFAQQLKDGIREWIDERRGLVSYECLSSEVRVGFRTRDDSLLFKLTFGGA